MKPLTCCIGQGYCKTYQRELWGLQWKRAHGVECTEEEHEAIAKLLHAAPVPSFLQKATNFTVAVATHAMTGMETVDDDTFYERLALCEKCPLLLPGWECGKCGCPLMTKARWAEQECPLQGTEKKWTSLLPNQQPESKCCGQ